MIFPFLITLQRDGLKKRTNRLLTEAAALKKQMDTLPTETSASKSKTDVDAIKKAISDVNQAHNLYSIHTKTLFGKIKSYIPTTNAFHYRVNAAQCITDAHKLLDPVEKNINIKAKEIEKKIVEVKLAQQEKKATTPKRQTTLSLLLRSSSSQSKNKKEASNTELNESLVSYRGPLQKNRKQIPGDSVSLLKYSGYTLRLF